MQHPSNREQVPTTGNSQNEELPQPISQDSPKEDEPAITLHGFRPNFGVPSVGPFDMKTEVQLQMMGLKYRKIFGRYDMAPKGKLPYIDDNGTVVADSTFIRFFLEEKYSKDLDHGLSDSQRASAWAAERLVEDNLYWAMVHSRWAVDANFEKGPAHFFDHLPDGIQDAARQKQRVAVLGYLHGQGFGRHTIEEIASLARRGYWALSQILGEKPFLTGDLPCGADASVFAQISNALTDFFESPTSSSYRRLFDFQRNLRTGKEGRMKIVGLQASQYGGTRAAGWVSDLIQDQEDVRMKSVVLSGDIKGWATAGKEYQDFMDRFDPKAWQE